jgi:hypothetical protein
LYSSIRPKGSNPIEEFKYKYLNEMWENKLKIRKPVVFLYEERLKTESITDNATICRGLA